MSGGTYVLSLKQGNAVIQEFVLRVGESIHFKGSPDVFDNVSLIYEKEKPLGASSRSGPLPKGSGPPVAISDRDRVAR